MKPNDEQDLATAQRRLAEIEAHPERLLSGAALDEKLKAWGLDDNDDSAEEVDK